MGEHRSQSLSELAYQYIKEKIVNMTYPPRFVLSEVMLAESLGIQENVLYESVKAKSGAGIADEVVYGEEGKVNAENDSDWVKSAMRRLESRFEFDTRKKIRMNCLHRRICKFRESKSCRAFLQ